MALCVDISGIALSQCVNHVEQVLAQHALDVPLIEHLDSMLYAHLSLLGAISEVKGGDAKFIEEAALHHPTLVTHGADAGHAAARKLYRNIELDQLVAIGRGQKALSLSGHYAE